MKNKKKFLALVLCSMLLSASFSVSAEEENNVLNETTTNTSNVEVQAKIPSTYLVKIPKNIIMTGNTGSYFVNVSGDLAGNETLTVTPANTFTLSQAGKTEKTVKVTQDKTSWSFTEMGTNGNGNINAEEDLTAGVWRGTFDFTIVLRKQSDDANRLTTPLIGSDAGFYDDNNQLVLSWADSGLSVPKDFRPSDKKVSDVTKLYPTATKLVLPLEKDSLAWPVNNPFFQNSGLKAIVLPEGTRMLGFTIFSSMKELEDVYLPQSLESIGPGVFQGCSSLDLTIQDNVTSIDESALSGVKHITYYGSATGAPWGAKSMN